MRICFVSDKYTKKMSSTRIRDLPFELLRCRLIKTFRNDERYCRISSGVSNFFRNLLFSLTSHNADSQHPF